jgi:hypothetical protein
VIEVGLAPAAQESPELVKCFRHAGEGCPRCDGSGFRPRKHCARCGESSGPTGAAKPLSGSATGGTEISPSTAWTATRSLVAVVRQCLSGWAADGRALPLGHLAATPEELAVLVAAGRTPPGSKPAAGVGIGRCEAGGPESGAKAILRA